MNHYAPLSGGNDGWFPTRESRLTTGLAGQEHSSTVAEQSEQSRSGVDKQSQPRIWSLPDKSVVMRKA